MSYRLSELEKKVDQLQLGSNSKEILERLKRIEDKYEEIVTKLRGLLGE